MQFWEGHTKGIGNAYALRARNAIHRKELEKPFSPILFQAKT